MVVRPPLRRSRTHRILGGVCGGFAEWAGWSPTLFRIVFVFVSVISAAFPGIAVYLVLWLVMPKQALDPLNPPRRSVLGTLLTLVVVLAILAAGVVLTVTILTRVFG